MSWKRGGCGWFRRSLVLATACSLGFVGGTGLAARATQTRLEQGAERKLAATVSETRMVEVVRRLVGFGPRMYGTPSNRESAAWLAEAFREAGLEVAVRRDAARAWYQPMSWSIRTSSESGGGTATLSTTWPSTGSPSAKGEGLLSLATAPGAVCLTSTNPTLDATAGCAAVLFDGRTTASGWPSVGRLRGAWTIPVFAISPRETETLRKRLTAGDKIRVSFELEAKTGNDPGETVVATLPGRDRSKYVLFCAHADSDSGGPGADDNASGVAIILEIARTAAAALKTGAISRPAWDLRFAAWGGEITSTREYVSTVDKDPSRLQAVFNYDQSGFGSYKDALYVEPDDVSANRELITVVRAVMSDHLGSSGFPEHAASVKTQGGTDSYVFQPRTAGATVYPSVTFYTSAWEKERAQPVTQGFPPLNWYPNEQPGLVTVDGDVFYHSVGDTPDNTTDTEPSNMGWCARVGLLSALRLLAGG